MLYLIEKKLTSSKANIDIVPHTGLCVKEIWIVFICFEQRRKIYLIVIDYDLVFGQITKKLVTPTSTYGRMMQTTISYW
jgi:hypothetical protein